MRTAKRNRRNAFPVRVALIITVILALCTLAAVFLAKMFGNNKGNLSGSWYREVDLTESVDKRICAWLACEDIDDIDPVKVKIIINIEETDDESVYNYNIYPDEESYKEAYETARAGFASEIEKMIVEKTGQAGYDLSSEEEARSVIEEALGMSMDDYVRDYLPALLPEYDELEDDYSESGTFSLNDSQIIWNPGGEEKQENCVMQDNLLIFSGLTDRVYRRAE